MFWRILHALLWSPRGLLAWLVLIVVVLMAWCFINRDTIMSYSHHRLQRDEVREEVDGLKAGIERLDEERDVLNKGGFEVERAARERFRLSKPGEQVLYLDPPPQDAETTGGLR